MSGLRRRIRPYLLTLAITLWSVFGLNLSSNGVVARNGHLKGEDYAHFYVLGRIALVREPALLYDMKAQARYLTAALPGAELTYFVPVYGPQVALALAPFGLLPYLDSFAAWVTTTICLYVACCAAAYRLCPRLRPFRIEIALCALASPALWQLVLHGQNSAIALASFTAGWLCLRAGRPFLAGVALGILFYKPQLALALCAILTLTGRWRVLSAMALAALLQLAAAASYFGATAVVDYARMLQHLPALMSLIEPKLYLMHSFRAFFLLLPGVASFAWVASIVCSAWLLYLVVRHWTSNVDPDLSFALMLIAALLISPHTSVYDLAILAPALIVIGDRLLAVRDLPARADARRCWVLVALAFVLPLWSTASQWLYVQPMVVCLTALVVCILQLPNVPSTVDAVSSAEGASGRPLSSVSTPPSRTASRVNGMSQRPAAAFFGAIGATPGTWRPISPSAQDDWSRRR